MGAKKAMDRETIPKLERLNQFDFYKSREGKKVIRWDR
jgi:hypothetical protein